MIVICRTLTDDNKVNIIDRGVGSSEKAGRLTGGAENAGPENAGPENAGPNRRA